MRIGVYFGNQRPEVGGGYTYVKDLLDAFLDRVSGSSHHYVIFCTPENIEAFKSRPNVPNVELTLIKSPNRPQVWMLGLKYFSPLARWLLRRPTSMTRRAKELGIQIIWFVGVDTLEVPELPYVATVWDLQHRLQPFFPEVSNNRVWDKRELFYGYFLRRATYCLTGTTAGKQEIMRFYQVDDARIRVIALPTPGFVGKESKPDVDVRKEYSLGKEYVLYPAQFWPHKNHINLLLALKHLSKKHGYHPTLVMTGSDQGNLSHVRDVVEREGLGNQVRFLGFVSRPNLVALYQGASALTFVSYFGPDNIPPLEAFSLGCPVIASMVEGAQEQYQDAAVLVNPSSPEEIAEAIWRVHNDKSLKQKLIAAGQKLSMNWTAGDYINTVFGMFDEFQAIRRNWP